MVPGRWSIDALLADELAALGVVGLRQQRLHRHVDELRVAVEGLAVGVGELGALGPDVDELRIGGRQAVEIEALEQGQHLQQHRALRPGVRLQHAIGCRSRDAPGSSMVGSQVAMSCAVSTPLWRPPAHVHHLVVAAEGVDGFGDEALAPGAPRALDLGLASAAAGLGLLEDALVGLGVPLVGEQRAGRRHLAAGQIDGGRRRPVLADTAPRPWRWWREARSTSGWPFSA